jgi:hypothetical protein
VVEWSTLLLRIWEIPGSKLGPETGYPDWGVWRVSSVPPGECRDITSKLGNDRFLPNPFQFIHVSPIHSTLYIVLVTDKALLNKLQIDAVSYRLWVHMVLDVKVSWRSVTRVNVYSSSVLSWYRDLPHGVYLTMLTSFSWCVKCNMFQCCISCVFFSLSFHAALELYQG